MTRIITHFMTHSKPVFGQEWYEILNFPLNLESANSFIDSTFEHAASPPDYSEGFEERQYQYALLGVRANVLALKLRSLSKLPQKEIGDWDSIQYMKDQKLKIEEVRKERYKQQGKMFKELSSSKANNKKQA